MRILALKTEDGGEYHLLAVRSDGVLLEVEKGAVGKDLPHNLFHYAAESAAKVRYGMWECIDRGGIYDGMRVLSTDDVKLAAVSDEVKKELGPALDDAEFLVAAMSVTVSLGLEGDAVAAECEVARLWPQLDCPDLQAVDLKQVKAFADRVSRSWSEAKVGEWLTLEWPME
jgi:hypothetical protein